MDAKQSALAFLDRHSVGVLSTNSPDGAPRSRAVYYSSDDAFAVYFLTVTGTRKIDDFNADAKAAFVVSVEDAPQTLQIEGRVTDITETAAIDPATRELVAKLQEKGPFFAPVAHLDPGVARLYKLSPTWVRWGDFTDGMGTDSSLIEIPL